MKTKMTLLWWNMENFFVIDAETYNRVDKVIGWHTHVLKTDVLSVCEPFCLTMPLNENLHSKKRIFGFKETDPPDRT